MAGRIIKERWIEEYVRYWHDFTFANDPDRGFSFDCDEAGNPFPMEEPALENYQKCINGEYNVVDNGIQECHARIKHPAIMECEDPSCRAHIELEGFTNTCQCGIDYNFAGQRLATREQWGEETGEHWTECY